MIYKFIAFFTLLISLLLGSIDARAFTPSKGAWKWADKQLKKLSDEEKVGQLIQIGINARYLNQEHEQFRELKRQVSENKVGGIILFAGGLYESVHVINRMQQNAKIPLLIASDFETGVGMRFDETINFPWNMAIAATGEPDFARRQGIIVGKESKALGVQQVYGPVFDVNNNPDNPVINVRSYGESPEEVARFGVAFTDGLQSQNVLATAKHFPGHGDTNIDSHRGLPIINLPRSRLDQIELLPFKRAVEAGIGSVMVAHISLPQIDSTAIELLKQRSAATDTDSEIAIEKATIPATLSKIVNQDLLRKELKFDGLIATDALSMSGLTLYVNQENAALNAFEAGADLLLKPADNDAAIRGLLGALRSGRITQARLNESVRKILAWKYQLGLAKSKITSIDEIDKIVSGSDTRNLNEEIAKRAVTLVKNDEGLLPLSKGKRVITLCITNGDDRNFVGVAFTNMLRAQGLRAERVIFDERSSENEIRDAISKIQNTDVVVAALFGRVRSGDKKSIGLPEPGVRVLREALKIKPTVNISFGNPYLLREIPEMKTYIAAYGDMGSLQRAVAGGIAGEIDFSGKLPITIGNYPRGTGLSLKK